MDIVIGEARIYSVNEGKILGWVLHGNHVIFDRKEAVAYAHKVDKILRGNKP